MRIPISIKLITITGLLLLVVIIPIALVTSRYFENTSRQREENVNLDYAAARATEVDNSITDLVYKTRSAAFSLMKMAEDGKQQNDDFDMNFMRDKNFLSIDVQKNDGTSIGKKVKTDVIFELCKCDAKSLEKVRDEFPFDKVREGQIQLQNSSYKGGPPMFTIGIPLVKDANGKITRIAIANVDVGWIQKPFGESRERTFFAADERGLLLAHSDERRVLARQDFSGDPIVAIANQAKNLPKGQRHLRDASTGEEEYSAYVKTSYGITVFSEIPDEIILEPAHEVKRRVFLVAGVIFSGALFVIFLFSLTLTSPIEKLVTLTEAISKGDFEVRASSQVRSLFRDEVGELATAFDHMTEGLRERDKVKSLFTKFHGSTVTADLMEGEIGLGGQRKDVLVFFSDIRGFTSYSEKRAPEEVVEMLNEYFGVMVSIINKHGGVVDKFIGDAIMAIWGAPRSNERDPHNAVMACLEMRQGLADLNARRIAAGNPPIMIGMGLHTGPAISGTIGSNERMEYTVIGNTVNTTSRIEAATKAFGTDFLMTDDVLARVGDAFQVDYAGAAEVKGRSEAIKMYKLRGYKNEAGEFIEVKTPYSEYEAEGADKVKIKESGEGAA